MNEVYQANEKILRQRLGISNDAERVLIFAESSHWDPNWVWTSEQYFEKLVKRNLDLAIEALLKEPQRIYSIECMFFLRMYWERCPWQQGKVRALVNEGRLRLTSSGVTTADTLLPSTEAILRDFLIGQEWLRANGMTPEPTLAYFTDSFGCSPALPSLIKAAGFDRTAITRIDGMYFAGCDLESSKNFPRTGSSAARLLEEERSLDFVWRDSSGAEVLCHWNAFTYGQGDMLAYRGLSRTYIINFFIADSSERNVAAHVRKYADQLAPVSRTPTMFCPIGFDFVEPIPNLVALLDRYNRTRYPSTGIWVVNAGLDDYLALVDCYREQLPVLELDPNPFWTGFYTSRPALKKRCHDLVDSLLLAEQLSLMPENQKSGPEIMEQLADAWWVGVTANHHDFITGTSPDEVVEQEQIPWLENAAADTRAVIQNLKAALPGVDPVPELSEIPQWNVQDGGVEIRTRFYAVELSEEAGGAIVCARHANTQELLLPGVSNDLISYRESGGLWRMGYEFKGGAWKEEMRASDQPVELLVQEQDDSLEISCVMEVNGEVIQRYMWFRHDSPVIGFRVVGRAPAQRTITSRFATAISANELVMDSPGGMVVRPPQKVYDPTFWPLHRFVHIRDKDTGSGLAIIQRYPGAISYQPDGRVELVALRNATREKAYVFIPIPGNPAEGFEKQRYVFDYALVFTSSGDWRQNNIADLAYSRMGEFWKYPNSSALRAVESSVVTTDNADVWVAAVKPACRGDGVIVRLCTLSSPGEPVVVTYQNRDVKGAFLCDARERNINPLEMHNGSALLTMSGTIATLRFLF
jgi:hypothetical protein